MTTAKNNKATHRGTCQVCGAVQCVTPSGMAKHGYQVVWGYFNGVCSGSHRNPLEVDKSMTEATIAALRNVVAPKAEKLAAALRSMEIDPIWTKATYPKPHFIMKRVEVQREELTDYEADQCRIAATFNAESEARGARAHATMLEKLIAARHGKALFPIKLEDKKENKLVVGARVLFGGEKGDVAEVIEIKGMVASGCGPHLNGHFVQHAVVRFDNGQTCTTPCSRIRTSAIQ